MHSLSPPPSPSPPLLSPAHLLSYIPLSSLTPLPFHPVLNTCLYFPRASICRLPIGVHHFTACTAPTPPLSLVSHKGSSSVVDKEMFQRSRGAYCVFDWYNEKS
ncbi:hypothetical protein Syun_014920 [Stephania yunnanensis]|uniref:Uncharacterized protein n=1 Tax=Stephania yunnanensis TaxID=152371 RepID=A0AAP0JL36_9MAGN